MIDTKLINLIEKAMDGSTARQSLLSNNLANVNTPEFKRSDVDFQATLNGEITGSGSLELKKTNEKHIGPVTAAAEPKVITYKNTSLRNDGNNVDLDMELANLSENNLYFNSLATLLSSQLSILRQSISEGRS
jgi:flagellar basal-body rod protein FlgB